MPQVSVSVATVYLGFYLLIVFLSLSIACGLYYIAELIEEYTNTTRRILSFVIKLELLLHLLLIVDGLPFPCIAAGLAAHLSYLRVLRQFPYISLASLGGLLSTGCFLANLGLWLRHYWRSWYTVEYIAAFLLVTTLGVPFVLFLSMAGEQAVLPGAGGFQYAPLTTTASAGLPSRAASGTLAATGGGSGTLKGLAAAGPQRRGMALRFFDILRRRRDAGLPGVSSRLPSARLVKEKV